MSSPGLPFHLINAFTLTSSPHSGNQAAVVVYPSCAHPKATDEEYMQLVARDFNFAETAFVYPLKDGEWSLRWFTPETEVELCGHATLAASSVLFCLYPGTKTLKLQTRWKGLLTATQSPTDGKITITLPIPEVQEASKDKSVLEMFCGAVGVEEGVVKQVTPFKWGSGSLVFEIESEVDLKGLKVDFKKLFEISKDLVIVTQIASGEQEGSLKIASRVFAVGLGVDEDSVTGAAHAALTGYYLDSPVSSRLPKSMLQCGDAKNLQIEAKQLSLRGGELACALEGDKARITGMAVEMGRGRLAVVD